MDSEPACFCGSHRLILLDGRQVYCLICHAMTNVACYGTPPSYFHRVDMCVWCRSYEFVIDDTMMLELSHIVCHTCGGVSSSLCRARPDLVPFYGWLRVCRICDLKLAGDDGHDGLCDSCGMGEISLASS